MFVFVKVTYYKCSIGFDPVSWRFKQLLIPYLLHVRLSEESSEEYSVVSVLKLHYRTIIPHNKNFIIIHSNADLMFAGNGLHNSSKI